MNDQINQEILNELKSQTILTKKINTFVPILVVIFLVALTVLTPYIANKFKAQPQQCPQSWSQVRNANDTGDIDTALRIAKALTEKNPNDWYGYSYLGIIYNSMGDNKNAEINFSKAYELFPTKDNKENLAAIRSVLNK